MATTGRADRRQWGRWVALDAKPKHTTAMSTIWRVTKGDSPDVFALKTLRYEKSSTSTAYRRFVREIEILTHLRSEPGIVPIIESSLDGENAVEDELYFLMPWAETSLLRASAITRGQLEKVLSVGIEIARALGAAHSKGIIHRDVKPANILLFGEAWEVKVADFGIGFFAAEERLTKVSANTVGTDDYVAPELRGGGQADAVTPAADVYSLGKTLYSAISGGVDLPREWLDIPRYDLAAQSDDPRLLHFTGLLRRMITESPESRYQSMDECCAELERAVLNVRSAVPFRTGMYGGPDSAVERFVGLSSRLEKLTGHRRQDALADALRSALTMAHQHAQEIGSIPDVLTGAADADRPAGKAAAASCAEELLAVGIPLINNNDAEGLDDWYSEVRPLVVGSEDKETIAERCILPPAAMLSVHGMSALAWHRKRFVLLGRLIGFQLESADEWIHHPILANGASRVMPWLSTALPDSEVMRRFDVSASSWLEESLQAVAGLVVMRAAFDVSTELQRWMSTGGDFPPLAKFPGLFYPTAAEWASSLPRVFVQRPRVEQEVARELFGMDSSAFRSTAHSVSGPLARLMARQARRIDRSATWVPRVFAADWNAWCGGVLT